MGEKESRAATTTPATLWEEPEETYEPPAPAAMPGPAPVASAPIHQEQPATQQADPPKMNAAIEAARAGGFGTYIPSEEAMGPAAGGSGGGGCLLPAGTKIHADQETASTSTNASTVTARIPYAVLGEGGCLAIAQGAMLIGTSAQGADFGQQRSNFVYDTLRQDGKPSIALADAAAAADPMGMGGVPGEVDNHTGMVATRVAIATVTGMANSVASTIVSPFGVGVQESSRAVDRWANQAIDLDPTLTTDPSIRRVPVMIITRKDLLF